MKRNEQIWWFLICLTLAAVFEIALFHYTNNFNNCHNKFTTAGLVLTPDLFSHCNSKNLPSQNENQSPQKPQQVYFLQAASSPCGSYFQVTFQAVPSWEKSYKNNGHYILWGFFMMAPVVRCFAIFYRLARSNPGDDWLNHSFYFNQP